MLNRTAVLKVGNFDANLRHTEDADLGDRLLSAGYDVVFDPALHLSATSTNSVWALLERYWRWNAGAPETITWRAYLQMIWYSLKVMVPQDLGARDPWGTTISLIAPHYRFWRSYLREAHRNTGKALG